MNVDDFDIAAFIDLMILCGYGSDITWAETIAPPATAEAFAEEVIFVICNSGMKNTVARMIYGKVMPCVASRRSAFHVFKHRGKANAIDRIWRHRVRLWREFMAISTDEGRLGWLRELPWIGDITKYHLAKNFGMQVAKPDVHLQRLSRLFGQSAQDLCHSLSKRAGLKLATIDTLLWRGAAIGALNTATGEFLPVLPNPETP